MLFTLLSTLLVRIFLFIGIGILLYHIVRGRGEKVAEVFVSFALNFLIPLYMFLSLWASPVPVQRAGDIMIAAAVVILAGALLAKIWSAARGIPFRAHSLPVIFMNSAYLAIPVNTVLWGGDGTTYAILFNIAITVLTFTLGIWWASRERPLVEIVSLPVLYGAVLGIAFNAFIPQIPSVAGYLNRAVALVTLPAMLIFVGYRLGTLERGVIKDALAAVALRMGGGLVLGITAVSLLRLKGTEAMVCVMSSSMPAAVYAYLLTERFEGNTPFAAAAVFLGTALSVVTIPLVAYILSHG